MPDPRPLIARALRAVADRLDPQPAEEVLLLPPDETLVFDHETGGVYLMPRPVGHG